MTAQTRNTLLLCLLSGVVCGLLTASQCSARVQGIAWILRGLPVDDSCKIAPAQLLWKSWSELLWLHWINWVPGVVYGLLYAAANPPSRTTAAGAHIILYSAASGAIYLLAGFVFVGLVHASLSMDILIPFLVPLVAGLGSGFVGGLALAVSAKIVAGEPLSLRSVPTRPWTAAFVGAAVGFVFMSLAYGAAGYQWLSWPIAFAIWQVAVGFAISTSLQRKAAAA